MKDVDYDIKITKIITDSDIDGITCASIISKIYTNCRIKFSDPSTVQQGRINYFVDAETIIMDLPYIDGCGLYFDHHPSNKLSKEFNGIWENTPSAARLVYDFYKDKFDLSIFENFLPDVDKFDSGNFTYDMVIHPSLVVKLAWAVKDRDVKFFRYLVNKIANTKLVDLGKDELIKEKIAQFDKKIETFKKELMHHVQKIGKIAFVDLRDTDLMGVHVSIAEAQLMDCEVIILIKTGDYDTRFSLYQNNLLELPYDYNLLAVANKINPQFSGGHKKGCGLTMPENSTVEETIDTISHLVKAQSLN